MRYAVVHEGTPIGYVELSKGELVAGPLAPLRTFDVISDTVRDGSAALLALGFFGAALAEGQRGSAAALQAAAALQFDLLDDRGGLVPTTFVNLIEAPDGGVVVLACFRHAHASVPAVRHLVPRADAHTEWPDMQDGEA